MVPVGDGQGLSNRGGWTGSGMLIFNGGNGAFFFGGVSSCGGGGAVVGGLSSTKDWNTILIFVLGNLRTHLQI